MRILLLALIFIAPTLWAKAMVWQVSNGEHTLYLAGTMHLLSKSDYPLPKAYQYAYAKADSLYFEADTQMQKNREYQRQAQALLFYPEGQSLSQYINSEAEQKLGAYLKQQGLSMQQFSQMRPSLVGISVTVQAMMALGVSEPGVDAFYLAKARKAQKPVYFFETPLEQLHFLAELGEGYESQFILESLAEVKQLADILPAMKNAWREGDVEALQALAVDNMKQQYPKVYQSLLVSRNQKWLPIIEAALNDKPVELILVGSAHLLGEHGLLQSLTQKGFTLAQLP